MPLFTRLKNTCYATYQTAKQIQYDYFSLWNPQSTVRVFLHATYNHIAPHLGTIALLSLATHAVSSASAENNDDNDASTNLLYCLWNSALGTLAISATQAGLNTGFTLNLAPLLKKNFTEVGPITCLSNSAQQTLLNVGHIHDCRGGYGLEINRGPSAFLFNMTKPVWNTIILLTHDALLDRLFINEESAPKCDFMSP